MNNLNLRLILIYKARVHEQENKDIDNNRAANNNIGSRGMS